MAAYRSPKPLVGVRVPGGMPNFLLGCGVIGNTTDFDSVVSGSIPDTSAIFPVSSKVEHSTDNRETKDRYLDWEPSFILAVV